MKGHFHDDTCDTGYEAMAQALTLLGFDVPKLIEFVATTFEPIWTELTLAYLRVLSWIRPNCKRGRWLARQAWLHSGRTLTISERLKEHEYA